MRIVAIWDRQKAAPESKTSFCLLENGRFLTVAPEEEYQGTDKEDNRIYKDTGKPEYYSAFNDEDRFDFKKAHLFISHFGGNLLYHKGEKIEQATTGDRRGNRGGAVRGSSIGGGDEYTTMP